MSARPNRPAEVQVAEKDATPASSSTIIIPPLAPEPIIAPVMEPTPTMAARMDNRAAARLAAENATQHYNFEPLLTKLFTSEKDLLDTIHAIFPKGVKVCRKDKWKDGPSAGMHKKWRFVCECGGQPRRNFNGSPARRTKKIGCPFFINAFWSQSQRGPRITTASLYHLGHEEVEVNQLALAALTQEQMMAPNMLLQEHTDSSDPSKAIAQKEILLNSLKLKMDYHLKYMIANYPLDFVISRVNEFLAAEGPSAESNPVVSSGALLSSGSLRAALGEPSMGVSSYITNSASTSNIMSASSASFASNGGSSLVPILSTDGSDAMMNAANTSKGPHAARKRKDAPLTAGQQAGFEDGPAKYPNNSKE